jgi:hypothetical protein
VSVEKAAEQSVSAFLVEGIPVSQVILAKKRQDLAESRPSISGDELGQSAVRSAQVRDSTRGGF